MNSSETKPDRSAAGRSALLSDSELLRILEDLVHGFSEQVSIVDENWTILCANDAWNQMITVGGYPLVPGANYREFLETFVSKGHENAKFVLAGIRAIDRGQTDSFEFTYAGVDEWAGRKLNFRIHRTHFQGRVIATLARQDVTDSFEVDRLRRELAAAVVDSESKARERLTRELHDSTGQLLTSIGLLLATAEQKSTLPECTPIFEEMRSLLAEATREVRSMSYLSQKPDLAEIEIVESLDSLAKGFSSRSKLKISFDVLGRRTELIPATKIVVYRIAQESLSNIHRHARARRAQLSLVFKRSAVHLVIADDGVGISNDTLAGKGKSGVGLVGMRSRLADIGGRLSIRRLRKGTAIVATIPVDVHSS